MAQSLATPYNDIGIYPPYHDAGPGNQWSHEAKLHADSFLLVEAVSRSEFVVQSLGNGQLYVNKLLEGGGKDFVGPRPPELKVSTAPVETGADFVVGYPWDEHNKKIKGRARMPGWWRAEESDVTATTEGGADAAGRGGVRGG
ncbi:hypothetical protein PG994_007256 [Apiospora phragmitis]|uniref:Uncharacterized protein n=1 Tax=Apiospora phragmitis TaxID=2905665 RepID=A0ABR1V0A3_9PEZI